MRLPSPTGAPSPGIRKHVFRPRGTAKLVFVVFMNKTQISLCSLARSHRYNNNPEATKRKKRVVCRK